MKKYSGYLDFFKCFESKRHIAFNPPLPFKDTYPTILGNVSFTVVSFFF